MAVILFIGAVILATIGADKWYKGQDKSETP